MGWCQNPNKPPMRRAAMRLFAEATGIEHDTTAFEVAVQGSESQTPRHRVQVTAYWHATAL